jgi:cell wall-associated NlpC family hydrolase
MRISLRAALLVGVFFALSNFDVPCYAEEPERVVPSSRGERIAERAAELEGVPYRWGGASEEGVDCSGLVLLVYSEEGIALPHSASSFWGYPQVEELLPGDILLFANTYRAGISHAGIYLGDYLFVHSASPSLGTIVSSLLNPYWQSHFWGAVRP